ncbi:MAG: hypothetical protein QGI05_00035, partial [Candidatus Omnitrophota bacterium]|nr:hypothetical protein [Candidatus Omnitrophota bacterium]
GLFTGKRALPEKSAVSKKEIEDLIEKRNKARNGKDFKTADSIRKKLSKLGIALEDQKGETTWRVK